VRNLAGKKARLKTVAAVCVLAFAVRAQAQNRCLPARHELNKLRGHPLRRVQYVNQLLFYFRDQAKDDAGNTLPVTGQNHVSWAGIATGLQVRHSHVESKPGVEVLQRIRGSIDVPGVLAALLWSVEFLARPNPNQQDLVLPTIQIPSQVDASLLSWIHADSRKI